MYGTYVIVNVYVKEEEGGGSCRSISVLFPPAFIHAHTPIHKHTRPRIYAFAQFFFVHSFRVHAFVFSSAVLNVVIFPFNFYTTKCVCHWCESMLRVMCATYFLPSLKLFVWLVCLVFRPNVLISFWMLTSYTLKNAFGRVFTVNVMIRPQRPAAKARCDSDGNSAELHSLAAVDTLIHFM